MEDDYGNDAWVLSKISVKGDGECIIRSAQAALRHKGLHEAANELNRERVLQRLKAEAESNTAVRSALIEELLEDENFCRQGRFEATRQEWEQERSQPSDEDEGIPDVPNEVWEWMHHQ